MSEKPVQSKAVARHRRRTPFSARAEPRVWLMGSSIVISLALIVFMVVLIVGRGVATFWPRPIEELHMTDGTVMLGVPFGDEAYDPADDAEAEQMSQARASGTGLGDQAWANDGRPIRRRFFVGNRDLGQESFRWVPLWQVESIDRPEEVVLIEREDWGPFLGRLEGVSHQRAVSDSDASSEQQSTWLAQGEEASLRQIHEERVKAASRWHRRDELNLSVMPGLQSRIRLLGWREQGAVIEHERTVSGSHSSVPLALWLVMLIGAGLSVFGAVRFGRGVRHGSPVWRRMSVPACWVLAILLALATYLERPGSRPDISAEELARIQAETESRIADLRAEQESALAELKELRARDAEVRVVAVEPTRGRISATSQSQPDEPMQLSQVVRVVEANRLGLGGKLGVYFDRWWEYLSQSPRDGSAAGGVFPVIVGTVTLTLLLTISVVPLGVIAALHLREYARQGLVTSIIRIAINNLAGVPSIVYGMFGLGFFCYILGGYIDAGPNRAMGYGRWWLLLGVISVLAIGAIGVTGLLRRTSVTDRKRRGRWVGLVAFAGWATAVSLAGWAIAATPYFHGFFENKLPEQPTFGGRGILWASLTLALLTLPVVIVATEEAIAAVPGSMREGSYGCGASKWQTIRRIVLPSAMPGIMTGAILAMARGAGEVAPLMLVGAVNLAPALPVSTEAPFLHGDRTFMHLGFHIYTLGFQNPDSEATEPLVWTTTLLLLVIVFVLNLAAIILRARLRARMRVAAL